MSYPDVGGIWTICHGQTQGVKKGDTATKQQCDDDLAKGLVKYGAGVDRCINHALADNRKAAFVSVSWNIGVPAFCSSSMAKFENAGWPIAACDALLKWNKVRIAGLLTPWPGLTNRREKERRLCLS